jgi:hypothetical protein
LEWEALNTTGGVDTKTPAGPAVEGSSDVRDTNISCGFAVRASDRRN